MCCPDREATKGWKSARSSRDATPNDRPLAASPPGQHVVQAIPRGIGCTRGNEVEMPLTLYPNVHASGSVPAGWTPTQEALSNTRFEIRRFSNTSVNCSQVDGRR